MMLSLITLQIANISITMSDKFADEIVIFAIIPALGLGTIGIIMIIAYLIDTGELQDAVTAVWTAICKIKLFKVMIAIAIAFCSWQLYKMRVSYVESNNAKVEAIWNKTFQ